MFDLNSIWWITKLIYDTVCPHSILLSKNSTLRKTCIDFFEPNLTENFESKMPKKYRFSNFVGQILGQNLDFWHENSVRYLIHFRVKYSTICSNFDAKIQIFCQNWIFGQKLDF